MKDQLLLTVTSLLALLLLTFHLSDDIVRGFAPGGLESIAAVAFIVVWLFAVLVLGGRRSGLVIILLCGLFGAGVPVLHMRGRGMVGGRIAGTSGMFFWVETLLLSAAISAFSAILAVRGLWNLRRGATHAPTPARRMD